MTTYKTYDLILILIYIYGGYDEKDGGIFVMFMNGDSFWYLVR